MNPDGWAEWQGAVSLVAGDGYTYFSGNPIIAWPPLYSIYIGGWTVLLGPTGRSLIVSHGVLVVLQAFLWVAWSQIIVRECGLRLSAAMSFVLSAFLAVFVCFFQPSILSHNLLYTLLPLLLWALWRLVSATCLRDEIVAVLLVAFIGSLILLTHNAGVAFVAAAAAIIALQRPPSVRSILAALFAAGVPLAVWVVTRAFLGQAGSHFLGWGAGKYGSLAYVAQLLEGVGAILLPERLPLKFLALPLILLAALMLSSGTRGRGLRFGLLFSVAAMGVTLLLFNISFIDNRLSHARYIAFLPLVLLPPVLATAAEKARPAAGIVLGLLLMTQVYWTALAVRTQQVRNLPELGFRNDPEQTVFVPPNAYIDRSYRTGPPVATDRGLLVAPLSFEEPRGRRR